MPAVPIVAETLVHAALNAALLAGARILEVYEASDFNVETKGDGSPLTRADGQAHAEIARTLAATDLPLLSEEGRNVPYAERSSWERFWLVDPLDGTKEFIKRNGEFTVNIALIEGQTPIFGVVYAPVTGVLYFGGLGRGARVIRDLGAPPESVSELIDSSSSMPGSGAERPFRVVGSRSHSSPETTAYVAELQRQHPDLELVSLGSSLKLCMVAEGTADVYPRFAPTMEWDMAAAHAIVTAAGGEVLIYENGGPLGPVLYNKENLLNPWFLVKNGANSN